MNNFENYIVSHRIEEVKQSFKIFQKEVLQMFSRVNDEGQIRIEKLNKELIEKLHIYESEYNHSKICVHCNKEYLPQNNHEVKRIILGFL